MGATSKPSLMTIPALTALADSEMGPRNYSACSAALLQDLRKAAFSIYL